MARKILTGLNLTSELQSNGSPGTLGQVLLSGGTSAVPTWGTFTGITASSYVAVGVLAADQALTVSGTDTPVSFIDYVDPQGWWNPTTKRFTPTIAGYYNITYQTLWTALTSTSQTNTQIRKNGNSETIQQRSPDANNPYFMSASKVIYLNGSTDYIEFTAWSPVTTQSLSQGNAAGSGTSFSASLITSGANITSNALTVGTSGLTMTTGSSPWTGSAAATIDIDTTKVPRLSQNNTFTGVNAFNNSTQIGGGFASSTGLEIGYTGGTATTPFIDFHSGATATDYDSRIIASGGTGTNGAGTLTYTAASNIFTGTITAQSAFTAQANATIFGANAGSTPLTVRGRASQTANIYEIQADGGGVLGGVTSAGRLYVQRQEGIQFMDGISTLRSRIYSAGTNGLFFDTGGGNVRVLTLDGGSETITGNLFYPYSSGRIGLIVRGVASQSANLQEWQDSTPTTVTSINSAGLLSTTRNITIAETNTAENAFIIRGAANHTGYLTLWTTSAGSNLGGVNPVGQIWTGSTIPTQGSTTVAIGTQTPTGTTNITITTGATHGISVGQTVAIAGVTPSGYNGTWTAQAGTTGTTLVVNIGSNPGAITGAGVVYMSPQVSITPSSTNTSGLIVKALASQSANLLEIQSSAGAVLARFASTGQLLAPSIVGTAFQITSGGVFSNGSTSAPASTQAYFLTTSASNTGLVVRAAASQSADLLQIQDSAGVILAEIDSVGAYTTNSANGYSIAGAAAFKSLNSGQTMFLTAGGSVAANPHVVIRQSTAATGSLTEWQNSAGTVLGGRSAVGQLFTGSTAPLRTNTGGATTAASGTGTTATITTTSSHNLAVGDRVTVAGVTPTGYNGTFILTAVTSNTLSYASSTTGSQTIAGTVAVDAQASITSRSAATTTLILRAATSQAVSMFRIEGSGGSAVIAMDAAGAIVANSSVTTGGALNLNYASPAIASTNASAASIFTSTVTGVTIGSSTIRTTAFPADATTSTATAGAGFMGLPQNATTTGAYTIVAADAGKHIYSSATRTVTIPANGTVAFPVGTTITFISGSGATTTIAITTDTMYLAGAGTTGSRTLAAFGMATAVKITSTAWIISGNGLT
jgi:hypothetical protein